MCDYSIVYTTDVYLILHHTHICKLYLRLLLKYTLLHHKHICKVCMCLPSSVYFWCTNYYITNIFVKWVCVYSIVYTIGVHMTALRNLSKYTHAYTGKKREMSLKEVCNFQLVTIMISHQLVLPTLQKKSLKIFQTLLKS